MNELSLYQFFKDILSASITIEGRFVVLPGYSNDLNSDNFNQIFTDSLGGIKDPKKYPLAFMFPPTEIVETYDDNWNTWKLQMFFMAQPFQGSGGIQNSDFSKNISQHTIQQTWKDMTVCAKDFMRIFNMILESKISPPIRKGQRNRDVFTRYSGVGNDNLSGIGIDFEVLLYDDCTIRDYDKNKPFHISFNDNHQHHKY